MKKANVFLVIAFLAYAASQLAGAAQPPGRHDSLQALSPAFWKLVPHGAKLTQFATGFGFTEGPVWDSRNFLYVSDEVQNKIYRVYPGGRRETVIALGDPDGNTDFSAGRLTHERIFGDEPGGPHEGVPDGMRVDESRQEEQFSGL